MSRFLRHRDWAGRGPGPAGAFFFFFFPIFGTPPETFCLFEGGRGDTRVDEACRSRLIIGLSYVVDLFCFLLRFYSEESLRKVCEVVLVPSEAPGAI